MKRYLRAADKVDLFLKYHDDSNNYHHHPGDFDKMYEILEQYDDSNGNDPVNVAFEKATPEDQDRMLALITPGDWALKVGDPGYTRYIYYQALKGYAYDSREANEAFVDAIEALFAEGLLNESEFRTDL